MRKALISAAFMTITAGPVLAQGAQLAQASAKTLVKKEAPRSEYWVSRDLSNVLTKVVTLKVR